MHAFTPRSIIAGYTLSSPGQELEASQAAASTVLGTSSVALICSKKHGEVWYLAAPASDLASDIHSSSPLSIALPGSPGHEGEGAYRLDIAPGLQAVIVCKAGKLKSFLGVPALVERFIALEQVEKTVVCESGGSAWVFPESLGEQREQKILNWTTKAGLMVATIAAVCWLWAAAQENEQRSLLAAAQERYQQIFRDSIQRVAPTGYPKPLSHLHKAIEHAVREKGVLVQFEYKEGRSTWSLLAQQRSIAGEAQ